MVYRKMCEVIQNAWDTVSTKWSADIKSKYFSEVYLPLLEEAEGIYQRNNDLEDYAASCISSLTR